MRCQICFNYLCLYQNHKWSHSCIIKEACCFMYKLVSAMVEYVSSCSEAKVVLFRQLIKSWFAGYRYFTVSTCRSIINVQTKAQLACLIVLLIQIYCISECFFRCLAQRVLIIEALLYVVMDLILCGFISVLLNFELIYVLYIHTR